MHFKLFTAKISINSLNNIVLHLYSHESLNLPQIIKEAEIHKFPFLTKLLNNYIKTVPLRKQSQHYSLSIISRGLIRRNPPLLRSRSVVSASGIYELKKARAALQSLLTSAACTMSRDCNMKSKWIGWVGSSYQKLEKFP